MLRFEDLPEINSPRWLSLEDLEGEEWRDVIGAEGYYKVSNYGRVKSVPSFQKNHYNGFYKKERIKKLNFNAKGYIMCVMTVNCKKIYPNTIARLVAMAFIPNPDNKPQVDHISTNILDNRVCNLRWVTAYENAHNIITEKRVQEARSKQIGRKHGQETRRKISEKRQGDKNPMYGRCGKLSHRSKPVIQLSLDGKFICEWINVTEANKVYKGHIGCCARGKRMQAGGYKWVYKENYKT